MRTPSFIEGDWWPDPLPHNVVFHEGAHLQSGSSFMHHASAMEPAVSVGHDTGIYDAFFELGPRGQVTIGAWCTIAGSVFATNGPVVVGDHCLMSYGVVVGDSHFAAPPEVRSDSRASAPIVIGDNVWISARATILPGIEIGEGAIIGAGTIVTSDVPAFAIVAGDPTRVAAWAKQQQPA